MYRSPRIAGVIAVAMLIGAPGATPARGAISSPIPASGIELDATSFAVAMSPSSDRSALAYAGPVVRSRTGRALVFALLGHGRSFSKSRLLEDLRRGSGARAELRLSAVNVSVAPDGAAVAAWVVTTATRRFEHVTYRLRVARAAPGARFGRPRTALTTRRPFELGGLVAGREGLAVLALHRDERVQVLVGRRGGRLSAPQDLGASTVYVAAPSLALASSGIVLAAWSPTLGSTAQAAILAPGHRRFAPARSVSAAGEVASYAGTVAGPSGAGVAWTTYSVQSMPSPVAGRVRFARLSSAGEFQAPATLADVTISGAGQVALPRGGAVTTWRRYIDKTVPGDSDYFVDSQLFARSLLSPDTTPRALSELPAAAFRPVIGAVGRRALVAWREAPVLTAGSRLRLAVAGPDGWEPTVTLGSDGRDVDTTPETGIVEDERPSGDLAIAAGRGSALIAWLARVRVAGGRTQQRVRLVSYRP
jgi:hypothetical protein